VGAGRGNAANVGWAREAWADLRRFSTGGTYLNFLNADDGEDRVRAALGPNFDRLAAVKARWDPENLFRVNRTSCRGRSRRSPHDGVVRVEVGDAERGMCGRHVAMPVFASRHRCARAA
jgi:hypothetical protein